MSQYFDINGTAMVHVPLTEAIRKSKTKEEADEKIKNECLKIVDQFKHQIQELTQETQMFLITFHLRDFIHLVWIFIVSRITLMDHLLILTIRKMDNTSTFMIQSHWQSMVQLKQMTTKNINNYSLMYFKKHLRDMLYLDWM